MAPHNDRTKSKTVEPARCSLCPSGEIPSSPDKQLNVSDLPFHDCTDLEGAVAMYLEEGAGLCTDIQSFGTYCGCPRPEDSCSLCRDGSNVSLPQKPLAFLSGDFGFVPTCGLLEARMHSTSASDAQCADVQVFGSMCGCPPMENHCEFCDSNDVITEDFVVPRARGSWIYNDLR